MASLDAAAAFHVIDAGVGSFVGDVDGKGADGTGADGIVEHPPDAVHGDADSEAGAETGARDIAEGILGRHELSETVACPEEQGAGFLPPLRDSISCGTPAFASEVAQALDCSLSLDTLEQSTKDALILGFSQLDHGNVRAFAISVQHQWSLVWAAIPEFARGAEADAKRAWFVSSAGALLRDFESSSKQAEGDKSSREALQDIVSQFSGHGNVPAAIDLRIRNGDWKLSSADAEELALELRSAWDGVWSSIPVYARLDEEDSRRRWFETEAEAVLDEWFTTRTRERKGASPAAAKAFQRSVRSLLGTLELNAAASEQLDEVARVALEGDDLRFVEMVENTWRTVWEGLPAYARLDESSLKERWFHAECAELVRKFFEARAGADASSVFWQAIEKQLTTESLAGGRAAELKRLASKLSPPQIKAFGIRIEELWNSAWASLPDYAKQDERHTRTLWFTDVCAEELRRAAENDRSEDTKRNAAATAVWSVINAHYEGGDVSNACGDQVRQAIAGARHGDDVRFEQHVTDSWKSVWDALPPFARGDPEATKRHWFTNEWSTLVLGFFLTEATSKVDASAPPSVRAIGAAVAPSEKPGVIVSLSGSDCGDVFSSPKRRRVATTTLSQTSQMTVEQVHQSDPASATAIVLTAYVLHVPEAPRLVDVPNKKTKSSESVPVVSVLLADRTGPISLDLWRNAAEDVLRDYRAWSGENSGPMLVEWRGFAVRRFARKDVPFFPEPMRKLSGTDKTTWSLIAAADMASVMDPAVRLGSGLYCSDLSCLDAKTPFFVSLKGIVFSVGPETESQTGSPMLSFKLHDIAGRYASCMAFGRHASNEHLHNGAEVVLFFTSAKAGYGGGDGPSA